MTRITEFYLKTRAELKADYLSGFTPVEIAEKYGYKKKENIYYYLRNLTPEERGTHVTNYYKRKMEEKTKCP
jgi:hypothetical protein